MARRSMRWTPKPVALTDKHTACDKKRARRLQAHKKQGLPTPGIGSSRTIVTRFLLMLATFLGCHHLSGRRHASIEPLSRS
jgi:hypothetical protein